MSEPTQPSIPPPPQTPGPGRPAGPPHPLLRRTWLLCAVLFAVLVPLALAANAWRPHVYYIPSAAMHPTLVEDDRILVRRLMPGEPKRGDVVIFLAPPEASPEEAIFVKRIVGLPGDTVAVSGGRLMVNGRPAKEPYVAEPISYPMPPVRVAPGKVFVMGDNRNNSNDSHIWGQLDESRLRGKAIRILMPPGRAGPIR